MFHGLPSCSLPSRSVFIRQGLLWTTVMRGGKISEPTNRGHSGVEESSPEQYRRLAGDLKGGPSRAARIRYCVWLSDDGLVWRQCAVWASRKLFVTRPSFDWFLPCTTSSRNSSRRKSSATLDERNEQVVAFGGKGQVHSR